MLWVANFKYNCGEWANVRQRHMTGLPWQTINPSHWLQDEAQIISQSACNLKCPPAPLCLPLIVGQRVSFWEHRNKNEAHSNIQLPKATSALWRRLLNLCLCLVWWKREREKGELKEQEGGESSAKERDRERENPTIKSHSDMDGTGQEWTSPFSVLCWPLLKHYTFTVVLHGNGIIHQAYSHTQIYLQTSSLSNGDVHQRWKMILSRSSFCNPSPNQS